MPDAIFGRGGVHGRTEKKHTWNLGTLPVPLCIHNVCKVHAMPQQVTDHILAVDLIGSGNLVHRQSQCLPPSTGSTSTLPHASEKATFLVCIKLDFRPLG
jgi:hypothetical protein